MKYEITNTVIDGNELIVYYKFDNGEENSNRFPLTVTFMDIKKWGDDRVAFFENREIEIQKLNEEIQRQAELAQQEELATNEE